MIPKRQQQFLFKERLEEEFLNKLRDSLLYFDGEEGPFTGYDLRRFIDIFRR